MERDKGRWKQTLNWRASFSARLARARQQARFAGTDLQANADMGPAEVRQYCQMDEAGRNLMRTAMRQMNLSARAFHRVLKVARTIADLAGAERIETPHLAEAIQYRRQELL